MSETLCLQWNDFKENANALFENLREDHDFTDVTLACEDGKLVEAHKVILVAASPFFKTLLAKHKHPHPLIFMRGVNSENLSAIVDFLYRGEANILQDNLDSFLLVAEDLKLKGLVGSSEVVREKEESRSSEEVRKESRSSEEVKRENEESKLKLLTRKPNNQQSDSNVNFLHQEDSMSNPCIPKDGGTVVLLNNSDEYMQRLDEKVKSMLGKSEKKMQVGKTLQRVCLCKVCGKEGQWVAIRDHIEAKHLEGVSLPCNQCEKTFRTRGSLRQHGAKDHH